MGHLKLKKETAGIRVDKKETVWLWADLPSMEYREAWDLQASLVELKRKGRISDDLVLILEHPAVFTLGRRGGSEHIKISEDVLSHKGIPVIPVERGGSITYHGPGQVVVYPILNLGRLKIGIKEYVKDLEEIMIRVCADWGIVANRDQRNAGCWVGQNKLGSIGIAVRHGISFHGFALNVNISLEPFRWVRPCGLKTVRMTSMKQILGKDLSMRKIRDSVRIHMQEVFGVRFRPWKREIENEELYDSLRRWKRSDRDCGRHLNPVV